MEETCRESSKNQSNKEKSTNFMTKVILNGKTVSIFMKEKVMQLQKSNSESPNEIEYQNIINVKRSKSGPGICINYLYQTSDCLLRLKRLKLKFTSGSESEKWSKDINKKIKNFTCNRIKTLFIFIDSISDRCLYDGKEIFDKQIKRILKDLKISFECKEIHSREDINKIDDYIESIKLSNGVLLMSGDETASSIINNILNYFQEKCRSVKEITTPFGIIPIGYHNDISNSIWGSQNVENALLNIILGNSFQADILSISSITSKRKVWGFNFQYGYYNIYERYRLECQTNKISDKESSLAKKAFKDLIDVECCVKFTSSNSATGQPIDDQKCHINCSKCNIQKPLITNIPIYNLNASMTSNSSELSNTDVKQDKPLSTYKWIIVNSIPCLNESTRYAFTPSCHFNDGTADLVLVQCKKKKDLKKVLKLLESDGSHLTHPQVHSVRIKDVQIILKSNSFSFPKFTKLVTQEDVDDSNEIIIYDEHSSSSSSDEDDQISKENKEETPSRSTNNKKKKSHKILQPMVKAFKEMTKTTHNDSNNETYKKPNMLESDRVKELKLERNKKKQEKLDSKRPTWMIDYTFLNDFNYDLTIKVYSGLVSFFGKAGKTF